MTENEYIAATNLAKIRIAIHAMRDVLPGFDDVTTEENCTAIISRMRDIEEKLSSSIELKE